MPPSGTLTHLFTYEEKHMRTTMMPSPTTHGSPAIPPVELFEVSPTSLSALGITHTHDLFATEVPAPESAARWSACP